MQAAAIIALCIGASILYGILHDQITARVCVEYFTVGHPPIFGTDSPTLLALGWGVIATWWVGLMLGVPLAIAARAGHRPRRDVRSLVRPIARLLLVMAACALAAGILGFLLAKSGVLILAERFAARVRTERSPRAVPRRRRRPPGELRRRVARRARRHRAGLALARARRGRCMGS